MNKTAYKLPSLSIFFPFYNDAGTVTQAIDDAFLYGRKVANKLEVIAIHGGNSKDNTYQQILKAKLKHPALIILNKKNNKVGYAVIKEGFKKATQEWVFYTDGDLQYHVKDVLKLVEKQKETSADVVNGYKEQRKELESLRLYTGELYRLFTKNTYRLPIRDLTCDFRLIRRSFLDKIDLTSPNASVLLELILKLQKQKASFANVPVAHNRRRYGKSNYNVLQLMTERIFGDFQVLHKIYKI